MKNTNVEIEKMRADAEQGDADADAQVDLGRAFDQMHKNEQFIQSLSNE